jgi:hypothetical protein
MIAYLTVNLPYLHTDVCDSQGDRDTFELCILRSRYLYGPLATLYRENDEMIQFRLPRFTEYRIIK